MKTRIFEAPANLGHEALGWLVRDQGQVYFEFGGSDYKTNHTKTCFIQQN